MLMRRGTGRRTWLACAGVEGCQLPRTKAFEQVKQRHWHFAFDQQLHLAGPLTAGRELVYLKSFISQVGVSAGGDFAGICRGVCRCVWPAGRRCAADSISTSLFRSKPRIIGGKWRRRASVALWHGI
jgi:hypothetical protein